MDKLSCSTTELQCSLVCFPFFCSGTVEQRRENIGACIFSLVEFDHFKSFLDQSIPSLNAKHMLKVIRRVAVYEGSTGLSYISSGSLKSFDIPM